MIILKLYLNLVNWCIIYLWVKEIFLDLFAMDNIYMKENQVGFEFFTFERVYLVKEIKSYDDKLQEKYIGKSVGYETDGVMAIS